MVRQRNWKIDIETAAPVAPPACEGVTSFRELDLSAPEVYTSLCYVSPSIYEAAASLREVWTSFHCVIASAPEVYTSLC